MMKAKSLKVGMFAGVAIAAMSLSALGGPGPHQIYRPLHSKKEISALSPGSHIAHECPHCGTIAVSKVGKDQAHAEGFTCPECKMKITYRDTGGGKGARIGLIDCVDVKTGKKMSARVCALHKN